MEQSQANHLVHMVIMYGPVYRIDAVSCKTDWNHSQYIIYLNEFDDSFYWKDICYVLHFYLI